jgi:hypothetical protein
MSEDKKPNLFNKVLEAGSVFLDEYITKARHEKAERSEIASQDDSAFYPKSVQKDPTNFTATQGYQEKTTALSYVFQAQMAKRNSIVAAIIQTYQNKVSDFAKEAPDKYTAGFRIKRKNEELALMEIIEELKQDLENNKKVKKSQDLDLSSENKEQAETQYKEDIDSDQDGQISNRELRRKAKEILRQRSRKKIEAIKEMVKTCGSLKDRPFDLRRWDFDAFLRATVRDRLTYDQITTEYVQDHANRLHYWFPVDASTIRYASATLANYKNFDAQLAGSEILYPEKEIEALKHQRDAVTLDENKLAEGDYKYVQVVRGRIARAFTPEELSIGMANPTTDIYSNGYSISELELLTQIVASQTFTENYNRAYFVQGFSAKGILHIKANIPPRKLDSVRAAWNHLVKGNRNSFQTPILAGMDEVKWIPLTQNHADMEFHKWMNYLIKIICAIYQIDPLEINFGMKEEGGNSGGLSGDNTKEKLSASKTKGLKPLITFLQNYINRNIISKIDADYELEFVGIDLESQEEQAKREAQEVKYKRTVNELREECDLEPIPGMDEIILDPNYLQAYEKYSLTGKKTTQEAQINSQVNQMEMQSFHQVNEGLNQGIEKAEKKVQIDYYKIEK